MSNTVEITLAIILTLCGVLIAIGVAVGIWLMIFSAIDNHMKDYQECGGQYCQMGEK